MTSQNVLQMFITTQLYLPTPFKEMINNEKDCFNKIVRLLLLFIALGHVR